MSKEEPPLSLLSGRSGQGFTNKHQNKSGFSVLASRTSLGLWLHSVPGKKVSFQTYCTNEIGLSKINDYTHFLSQLKEHFTLVIKLIYGPRKLEENLNPPPLD